MNKAFTKESDNEDDELDAVEEPAHVEPAGAKNYITPSGLQRLRDELRFLLTRERPAVTQVVAWAAGMRRIQTGYTVNYALTMLAGAVAIVAFLLSR